MEIMEDLADPEMEMLGLKRRAQSALQEFRMAELNADTQQMVRDKLEKINKEIEGLEGKKSGSGTRTSAQPESRNPVSQAQGGADPALMGVDPMMMQGQMAEPAPEQVDPAMIQQLLAQRMQGLG